jgi:CO/xanthine dehydrogenase Mo-binding subunit
MLWKKLVGEILELSTEQISFLKSGLTDDSDPGPSILSRNISITTLLIKKCCDAIQKKRFRTALPIEIKRSYKPSKSNLWNPEALSGIPFVSHTFGGAIVEVETDNITFEPEIKNIWLYVNCGELLSGKTAKNNIESGIYQALNWVTSGLSWIKKQHRSGEIYRLPATYQAPKLHIRFLSSRKKQHLEGIEALPLILIPAAYINAVSQATGVYLDTIPVFPKMIQAALEDS